MQVPGAATFFLVALIASSNADAAQDRCYDPKTDFYELMGTRTAYELVHGRGNLRLVNGRYNNNRRADKKCKPLQLWMLSRHGTKYPENEDMPRLLNLTAFRDKILQNHEKTGAGHLCAKDLKNFRDWKLDPNINNKTDEELAIPQGQRDLEGLAKRIKMAYPELMDANPKTYSPNDYVFKSTNRQRTRLSMTYFANGFARARETFDGKVAFDNDTLLMPNKNCKAWKKKYNKNPNEQREKFIKGPEMKNLLKDVSERLGFKKTLDFDTVKSAWDMCRYEVAWYPEKVSVWCSIFRKEDLKVFEYSEDLGYYYGTGPGREMSSKLGCNALSDMFNNFKKLESSNANVEPKGIFYFTHSVTVHTLLSALKIGKEDTPFTWDSYESSANRKYHISKLVPFASNVLAVFYRCDEKSGHPRHRVSIHVAEQPAQLKFCDNGLCDWETLKMEYGPAVDSCSFDFCNSVATNSASRTLPHGFGLVPLATWIHGLISTR